MEESETIRGSIRKAQKGAAGKATNKKSDDAGTTQSVLPYEYTKKYIVSSAEMTKHKMPGVHSHTHTQYLKPTKAAMDVMKGSILDVLAGESVAYLSRAVCRIHPWQCVAPAGLCGCP